MEDGNTRAVALKTIDPAMDFGNGVSLTALTAATAAAKTKLDAYNALLSDYEAPLSLRFERAGCLDFGQALGETTLYLCNHTAAEKTVTDLSSRLLSGVKTKYGADSSQYEQAGGTRTSEIKRTAKTKTPPTK